MVAINGVFKAFMAFTANAIPLTQTAHAMQREAMLLIPQVLMLASCAAVTNLRACSRSRCRFEGLRCSQSK